MKSSFSVIVPFLNNLKYNVLCWESLRKLLGISQVILVDNGSTDGSFQFAQKFCNDLNNWDLIYSKKNRGFAWAVNRGLERATGNYIVVTNNDVIIPPKTLVQLLRTFAFIDSEPRWGRIGLLGPVSNYAAGEQGIAAVIPDLDRLDVFAEDLYKQNFGKFTQAGFLSGFFLMIKREVFDDVGLFDERFTPGGCEDNDYILRAQAKGFKAFVDQSTFVYHFGSKTISKDEFKHLQLGVSFIPTLYAKYHTTTPKKLYAVIRAKNAENSIGDTLDSCSNFCDGILVLDDNSTDRTQDICRRHPRITQVLDGETGFDERRDRNRLLRTAAAAGADWVISVDADEVLEPNFTREVAEKLMNPANPHVKAYGFKWNTFFLGRSHFRTDGIFGHMFGLRMYKVEPGQEIVAGTSEGLHCGNIPMFPAFNCRYTNWRILHYGYDSEARCEEKFERYTKLDLTPDPYLVGATDYKHLVSSTIALTKWPGDCSISLCVVVNDETVHLINMLDTFGYFVQEIVAVVNPGNQVALDLLKLYGAKIIEKKFNGDFSDLRNAGLEKATGAWILQIDPDEMITLIDLMTLALMTEGTADAYLFPVNNYQQNGSSTLSETIRMYRRSISPKYVGNVHEVVDQSVEAAEADLQESPITIHHYGFMTDKEKTIKKLELYERLTMEALERDPNDYRALFNLALHRLNDGDCREAAELLSKSSDLKPDFFLPHHSLGYIFLCEAINRFEAAKKCLSPTSGRAQATQAVIDTLTEIRGPEQPKI